MANFARLGGRPCGQSADVDGEGFRNHPRTVKGTAIVLDAELTCSASLRGKTPGNRGEAADPPPPANPTGVGVSVASSPAAFCGGQIAVPGREHGHLHPGGPAYRKG
ncbi:hypothetical protein GCM10023107_42980 [Actinoplanes octamycinicus]|nr:hypothetical protein Aoc01nite_56110 [Actinoplanes octamycinicus]